ncbi:hypothetical protein [Methanoregula sp.]|uniref:hypothetical protein n=1 Tax=Methanoregula sp. TaxID=2052170 RepID=UPI003BB17E4C
MPGLTKGISEKFNEIIQEMSKKSDFIFTIIVKHTTEQKFSSAFASYLDTYHVLGIEDPELRASWLWYLLLAQSIVEDGDVRDRDERETLFKKMGALIEKAISDRAIIQNNSDKVQLLQWAFQISDDITVISELKKKCDTYFNDLQRYENEEIQSRRDKMRDALIIYYHTIKTKLIGEQKKPKSQNY